MRDRYGERAAVLEDWIYRELCSETEKKGMKLNEDYPNYAAKYLRVTILNS